MPETTTRWPALPLLAEWADTQATLHRFTQVVGKVRLAHAPWVNHSWHVALHLTPRGLTTRALYVGDRAFEIELDLVHHALRIETSRGEEQRFALEPMPVATFYERTMGALDALGLTTRIRPMPVEIPDPVEPLDTDHTHASYDRDAVTAYFGALLSAARVLERFRAGFSGKVSPVHFFWGAFDLAVTRFSGAGAPKHPGGAPYCADWVMEEAYSHEVSSAGFWPGQGGLDAAAFYSYAYPEPPGFADAPRAPEAAYYHETLRELVLPYDAVRTSPDPDGALIAFLEHAYAAAADLGDWDRAALESDPQVPRGPRPS